MYTLCQTIARFHTNSKLIENLEKNEDYLEILAKNFLPSGSGFDICLLGRNFRDIKNYIGEMLHNALTVKIQLHWNKEDKMFSFSEVV